MLFVKHFPYSVQKFLTSETQREFKGSPSIPTSFLIMIYTTGDSPRAGHTKSFLKNRALWASLVAKWLRVCLLMQGTQVRALVWEDPTCRGAARPVSHNY